MQSPRCPAGHRYTDKNTRMCVDRHGYSYRQCRMCHARRSRLRYRDNAVYREQVKATTRAAYRRMVLADLVWEFRL